MERKPVFTVMPVIRGQFGMGDVFPPFMLRKRTDQWGRFKTGAGKKATKKKKQRGTGKRKKRVVKHSY